MAPGCRTREQRLLASLRAPGGGSAFGASMCRRTDDLRKSLLGRAVARHCHLLDGLLRELADDLLAGVDVAASLLLAEGSVGLVVGGGALGGLSPVRPRKDSTPRGL